jgi:hypothetical protein
MLSEDKWQEIQKAASRGPTVRAPDADERARATRELKKLIGGAASEPTWQERLRVAIVDGEPLLEIRECFQLRGTDESAPWNDPYPMVSAVVFYPLAPGAALLQDPERSPEAVLQRRKERIAEHAKQQEADRERALASLAATAGGSREERMEAERRAKQWRPDGWKNLPPTVQLALRLAYAVEQRDAALSAGLVTLAAEANRGGLACPSREWWTDLGRSD